MKNKVIIINGAATDGYLYDARKNINSFVAPEILSIIAEPILVGEPSDGFKFQDLHRLIHNSINSTAQQINIIIAMHGKVTSDGYQLLSSYQNNSSISSESDDQTPEWIMADEFIKTLTKATNGNKLNIFLISCYGANFIDYAEKLPIGSKVITLSEKNSPTEMVEMYHTNAKLMTQIICQNGFSIENLLVLYCLNQKFTIDMPAISIVKDSGIKTLNFDQLLKNYLDSSKEYSPFLTKMLDRKIYDQQKFEQVKDELTEFSLEYTKPPNNIFPKLLRNYEEGTLEEYKQYIEERFYFPNDLKKTGLRIPDDYFDNLRAIIFNIKKIKEYEQEAVNSDNSKAQKKFQNLIDDLKDSNDSFEELINERYLSNEDARNNSPLRFNTQFPNYVDFVKDDNLGQIISKHSIIMGLVIDYWISEGSSFD